MTVSESVEVVVGEQILKSRFHSADLLVIRKFAITTVIMKDGRTKQRGWGELDRRWVMYIDVKVTENLERSRSEKENSKRELKSPGSESDQERRSRENSAATS